MKRVLKPSAASAPSNLASVDAGQLLSFEPLLAHCATTKYDDGEPRQPGWFVLRTDGEEWTVRVSDPDSGCSFVARARTATDALLTASLLLGSDDCPWAPDRFLEARKPQKKKK